ncbi:YbdK family carboxylate-amine ligase [Agrococcus sp. SL85]|uniref:carboxylate-amine ligase n=1 Tax=Agrococcus sp. SL85 TaxID=2995141 RepID=UPI00226D012C|nr:YbdK family carboxylate-amine ligase [Agrococcus sp. SL85]WAC67149.1 YbdK family carboxylate-amine ligase [Agrococcus sp. SL85]
MTMTAPARARVRTFGIEEEVVLLDPVTLAPVDVADAVLDALPPGTEGVERELLLAQLEYASPVLVDAATASAALRGFRAALAVAAESRGVLAASVGSPPGVGATRVRDGERYAGFEGTMGALLAEHRMQGLHVHVGIASRDEGVRVMTALRPWLAPLLAVTANAPIAGGADTGFASWRTGIARRLTISGVPPAFVDAADYDRRAAALIGLGTTTDAASLWWSLRLCERYPTVEVRVCDAQPTAEESVAVALLVRALVEVAAADELPHAAAASAPELIDAAVWHAAKHGMGERLLHPGTGEPAAAWTVVEAMVDGARPALAASGDLARVERWLALVRREGTGAERQRAAFARGVPALATALRDGFVA